MRFWHAAASVPSQRTSWAHWQHLLGNVIDQASRWLEPTNAFASSIPRLHSSHHWLRVIEDEPHHYVAYDDVAERIVPIDRKQAAVFGINWNSIADSLCDSAGFERLLNLSPQTTAEQIGVDQPRAGFSFPVIMQRGPLLSALTHIADQREQPFVLLRLRSKNIDALCSRILRERHGLLLTLSESTMLSDDASVVFTPEAIARIDAFRQQHLPHVKPQESSIGFPTPAGCTWSAVRIRFIDGETVTISAGIVVGRYLYSQMGFAKVNNRRPNIQWELLRSLATGHGLMTWQSPDASRKNQKRRERLSAALIKFFRISGDPIRLTADKSGWQTEFALEPDR